MAEKEFDTTEFFMTNKEPVLFNTNSSKWNDNNNNFCPKCHYNYKSNYHRNHCENTTPIGDEVIPLLITSLFYYLILKNKSWKR